MQARVLISAIGVCGLLAGQPVLRLKSGRIPPPFYRDADKPRRLAPRWPDPGASGRMHLIVQFNGEPDEQTVKMLEERGARVLAVVPDQALLISTSTGLDFDGLDLYWAGALEVADKFSPLLRDGPEDERLAAVVELHADEEMTLARYLAVETGLEVLEHPDLAANQILVRGSRDALAGLAAHDEIAYLFPAAGELLSGAPLQSCAGPLWAAASLGGAVNLTSTYGEGWDGPGRGRAELSYWLGALAAGFPPVAVRAEIERALAAWSAVVEVDFTLAATQGRPRSLDIFFAAREHGDPYPFDGRGRTLAHGFFPPPNPETAAGDLHFDAEEMWRLGADVDVFSVTLHELGHSLGLGHSDDVNAVMYPYYRRADGLRSADIDVIRTLYAARDTSTPTPPAPTPPPANPTPTPTPTPPPAPAPPAAPDTVAPTLTFTSPSSSYYMTRASTLVVKGTAKDNVAVSRVTWSRGSYGGACTGATTWSTPAIDLPLGTSTIVIRVFDAAGNSSWKSLTAVRY